MFGFINLNKPAGFTSHDCVAKLRKLLDTRKIGHGGTLDPAATGVLPIAVGKATRLLQFLPEPKAYRACIQLGITTTTDDLAGEVLRQVNEIDIPTEQIVKSLNSFVGQIEQVPPMYSAIKKDGKKLYELARRGEQITLEPRTITVSKIELLNIDRTDGCKLEVEINCSPGTYIRAIARDLGEQLEVGGTLANLIRTESCGMHLATSLSFEEIAHQSERQTLTLIPPEQILSYLNTVTLTDDDASKWCQGQLIDLTQATASSTVAMIDKDSYLVTYSQDRAFLGISILYERNNVLKLKPKIVCFEGQNITTN